MEALGRLWLLSVTNPPCECAVQYLRIDCGENELRDAVQLKAGLGKQLLKESKLPRLLSAHCTHVNSGLGLHKPPRLPNSPKPLIPVHIHDSSKLHRRSMPLEATVQWGMEDDGSGS